MRRRFLRLLAVLIVGAAANLATAWVLLLRMPQGYEYQIRSSTGYELATVLALKDQYLDADTWPATKQRVAREVAYQAEMYFEPEYLDAPQRFEYTGEKYSGFGWRIVVIYASYTIDDPFVPSGKHWVPNLDSTARINLVGWPLPFNGDLLLERKGPNDQTFWAREKRFLEWPKFFVGTAGWATVAALLLYSWQAARRIYRNRRGECSVCGYDLRGDFSSGCPECGWRRAEKGRATNRIA